MAAICVIGDSVIGEGHKSGGRSTRASIVGVCPVDIGACHLVATCTVRRVGDGIVRWQVDVAVGARMVRSGAVIIRASLNDTSGGGTGGRGPTQVVVGVAGRAVFCAIGDAKRAGASPEGRDNSRRTVGARARVGCMCSGTALRHDRYMFSCESMDRLNLSTNLLVYSVWGSSGDSVSPTQVVAVSSAAAPLRW